MSLENWTNYWLISISVISRFSSPCLTLGRSIRFSPIMPIQRLDERPDRTATLQDITCDSDGKIANFISTRNVSHDLPVHSLKGKDAYYIGVFLGWGLSGNCLGDMHNLFGDTNAVHVTVDEKRLQYPSKSSTGKRLPKCLIMSSIILKSW